MAFLFEVGVLRVLFSRYLEFWVGASRKWGNPETTIWEALAKFLVCLLDVCFIRRWQSVNGFTCEKAKVLPISLAEIPTLQRIAGGRYFELRWRYEGGSVLWPRELSQNTSVRQLVVLANTCKSQVRVGADVPSVRGETICSLWVVQQPEVVDCCPGVQARIVKGCIAVTPINMLAVEVTNIQAGVWERRDGRRCESRAWRFVDVNDLISCNVYKQPLSLWLFWRLIDQWPFQPLVNKRSNAVLHAQD